MHCWDDNNTPWKSNAEVAQASARVVLISAASQRTNVKTTQAEACATDGGRHLCLQAVKV